MANLVPAKPEYPVLTELQTGEELDEIELARLAHVVNWAIAYVGLQTVVDEGFHDGSVTVTVTDVTVVSWKIPVPPGVTQVRIEIDAIKTGTGAPYVRFYNAASASLTFYPATTRGHSAGMLAVNPVNGVETVRLGRIYIPSGSISLYAVQMRFVPLAGPLTTALYGTIRPMGTSGDTLAVDQNPLDTALGQLLIANLEALRDRPRVLLNHAGIFGYQIVAYDHPEQIPRSVVQVWPGAAIAGALYTCHVYIKPSRTVTTWFRLLAEDAVVAELEISADALGTAVWRPFTFTMPDDTCHLDDTRPTLTLGFSAVSTIGDPIDSTGTNCGVMSIAIWGP